MAIKTLKSKNRKGHFQKSPLRNKALNTKSVDTYASGLTIRKILVPTDFSKSSRPALFYARNLAKLTGAKVYIMCVIEPVFNGALPYIQIDNNGLREKVIWDIERLQIGLFKGVKSEIIMRDGNPFSEIVTAAEEENVDLIVIATHGYTGIKHVLMGSTAERVIRHARCPVLVVRKKISRIKK